LDLNFFKTDALLEETQIENPLYEEFVSNIKSRLFLFPSNIHGIRHTKRVLFLGDLLAQACALNEADKKLLALACCYHDIGRINDLKDDEHGLQSSRKFLRLKLNEKHNLTAEETEIVTTLITMHALPDDMFVGNERVRLLYNILKDSDAIDRLRINDLDPSYLRLKESHDLILIGKKILIATEDRLPFDLPDFDNNPN